MSADTSVTSCTCILWFIVHHIGNTVKGFTFDAFCLLTFCTQLFFLCLAECCRLISDTSAFCFGIHFSAVGSTGYLLPNGKFLFGCINRRLALFLGIYLLGNGSTAFRLGFLQLLQSGFLVGYHSIGYGLCHSLIALGLLYDGIPSGVAVGLFIDRVALFVLWYSLHCRNILRCIVAVFGNNLLTIVANNLGGAFKCHSVMLQQHIVEFITIEQVYTLAIDRCFGIYLKPAVCICIGCNATTNSNTVLIGKGKNVIEGVLRSVSLLHRLLSLCVLCCSLLLELRHTCQVRLFYLLLNGLL